MVIVMATSIGDPHHHHLILILPCHCHHHHHHHHRHRHHHHHHQLIISSIISIISSSTANVFALPRPVLFGHQSWAWVRGRASIAVHSFYNQLIWVCLKTYLSPNFLQKWLIFGSSSHKNQRFLRDPHIPHFGDISMWGRTAAFWASGFSCSHRKWQVRRDGMACNQPQLRFHGFFGFGSMIHMEPGTLSRWSLEGDTAAGVQQGYGWYLWRCLPWGNINKKLANQPMLAGSWNFHEGPMERPVLRAWWRKKETFSDARRNDSLNNSYFILSTVVLTSRCLHVVLGGWNHYYHHHVF